MSLIADIKQRTTILDIWRQASPDAPTRCGVFKSPLRAERTESFSIFDSGRRFRDHGTGESGDLIDFCCLLWNCNKKEAVRKLGDGIMGQPIKILPVARKRKEVDLKQLESMKRECLASFNLKQDSVLTQFLTAKNIPFRVAEYLNKEGSLGMYHGAPAYIYKTGIKVRHKPDSSRSTRWIIGSDGGYPWRYDSLTSRIKTVLLTEGESDNLISCTALQSLDTRTVRVIAAPSASWRPEPGILSAITKDRRLIVAVDNDDAGKALTQWLMRRVPTCIPFPWDMAWELKDLCDLESGDLTHIYRGLIQNNLT
jgi:5S rRNA maturation endonuclease (ribonuclease M5)